jgi:hypothetical protein
MTWRAILKDDRQQVLDIFETANLDWLLELIKNESSVPGNIRSIIIRWKED